MFSACVAITSIYFSLSRCARFNIVTRKLPIPNVRWTCPSTSICMCCFILSPSWRYMYKITFAPHIWHGPMSNLIHSCFDRKVARPLHILVWSNIITLSCWCWTCGVTSAFGTWISINSQQLRHGLHWLLGGPRFQNVPRLDLWWYAPLNSFLSKFPICLLNLALGLHARVLCLPCNHWTLKMCQHGPLRLDVYVWRRLVLILYSQRTFWPRFPSASAWPSAITALSCSPSELSIILFESAGVTVLL